MRHELWEKDQNLQGNRHTNSTEDLVYCLSTELRLALLNRKGEATWFPHNQALQSRTLDLVWIDEQLEEAGAQLQIDEEGRNRSDHAVVHCHINLCVKAAGKKRKFKNLTFATIFGAGHMVSGIVVVLWCELCRLKIVV